MPRIVRTARGEQVDFDAIIIKQQLAQAPMNIEVARRKEFIDSREGNTRSAKIEESVITTTVQAEQTVQVQALIQPAKKSQGIK